MSLVIQKLGILATILSKEKISISVSEKLNTAMFDVISRVLYIPNWTDMPDYLIDMFVVHEIAHAKFTDPQLWMGSIENKEPENRQAFKNVLNVVEDARIDKKIQRVYPGTSRWYYKGVKELSNKDFFNLKKVAFKDNNILNRLNIYFKMKFAFDFTNTQFSDKDKYFIDKMSALETMEDTIAVAEELFKYCKDNSEFEKQPSNGEGEGGGEGEDENEGFIFIMTPEEAEEARKNGKIVKTLTEKEMKGKKVILSAKSQEQLENYKKSKIDQTPVMELHLPEYNPKDIIDKGNYHNYNDYNGYDSSYGNFALSFFNSRKKLINFCFSEFERKKRAKGLSKVMEYKTGKIDTNRLHQYKYSENIFLSDFTVEEHKNHGFVFLIDYSASMSSIISKVYKQIYILCQFCKTANIPFEVYRFTSGHNVYLENMSSSNLTLIADGSMNKNKLNNAFGHLLSRNSGMNSTPLTTSLAGMKNILENFKQKHKVEILNFMLLSDGACDNGSVPDGACVVDDKTHIRIPISENYCDGDKNYIEPILNIIKQRCNARISIYHLLYNHHDIPTTKGVQVNLDDFHSKGFILVKNKYGADSVFYVNSNTMLQNEPKSREEMFMMKDFIANIS